MAVLMDVALEEYLAAIWIFCEANLTFCVLLF